MIRALISYCFACGMAAFVSACVKEPQPTQPPSNIQLTQMATPYSTLEHVGKYAIRCSGYVVPGVPRPMKPSPLSYSAADVGKPGVPRLTKDQMASLKLIQRTQRPKHLRFVFLSESAGPGPVPNDFIIFDAEAGPCADFAPGYPVLNVRHPVNPKTRRSMYSLYYEPGENPYTTHGMTW